MDSQPTSEWRSTAAGAGRVLCSFPAICGILAVLPFTPLIIPDGRVIPSGPYSDYLTLQVPIREFAREEFLVGRFPLWIPYVGCGMPLHAGQQAALTYPLLMPLIVAFGANYGTKLALFLHLVLAYIGQYRLSRSLRMGRAPSGFAGIVTTQSGFTVAHLMVGHVTMLLAFAWIPWLLLAVRRVCRRPGRRTAALVALVFGLMILTGHSQMVYYGGLAAAIWGFGSLISGSAAPNRARVVGWGGGSAVLALLFGAVQLIPAMELVRDGELLSERGSSQFAGMYALGPADLVRLIVPNFGGNPLRGDKQIEPGEPYHEQFGYLGLATLILSVVAVTRRTTAGWEYATAAACVVLGTTALGHATPIFGWLGTLVPELFLFRCHGRLLSLVSVLLPLLAARGLDALIRRRPMADGVRLVALGIVLIGISDAVVWLVLQSLESPPWRDYGHAFRSYEWREWAIAGVTAYVTSGALFAAWKWGRTRAGTLSAAVIAVTMADLAYGNTATFSLATEPAPLLPQAVVAHDPATRFVDLSRPGLPIYVQLRYSQVVLTAVRYQVATLAANGGEIFPAALERLYRAAAARPREVIPVAGCGFVAREGGRWEQLPDALDRVRFLPSEDAALVEAGIEEVALSQWPRDGHATLKILSEEPCRLVVDCDAPSAGLLVVADTVYPGWKCLRDGEMAEIRGVHGVFRGVHVGPGRQRVEFRYEPASFKYGIAGSVLGSAGIAALVVSGWIAARRRSARRASSGDPSSAGPHEMAPPATLDM